MAILFCPSINRVINLGITGYIAFQRQYRVITVVFFGSAIRFAKNQLTN